MEGGENMALDNHTFTVLGQYRIIKLILGHEPTVSEFCQRSDYTRHGYHCIKRAGKDRALDQSTAEDKLMKELYAVLKSKYDN